MRLWTVILTICIIGSQSLLTGCATMTREDEERSRIMLRMGVSQMEAGDYPSALKTLLQAEQLNPGDAVIQNNLGLAYFYRDRVDLAEKHLRLALTARPDYTEASNNLGRILSERGKNGEAIQVLLHAQNDLTYPKPAKIFLNLGIAYFRDKQYSVAREKFRKTLEFGRDNCLAQSYMGRTYFETKDFKSAAEVLDRAVGFCKASQYDEPHYYSALAHYQLGQINQAESRLEEVVKIYSQGKYTEQAKSLLETIRR